VVKKKRKKTIEVCVVCGKQKRSYILTSDGRKCDECYMGVGK